MSVCPCYRCSAALVKSAPQADGPFGLDSRLQRMFVCPEVRQQALPPRHGSPLRLHRQQRAGAKGEPLRMTSPDPTESAIISGVLFAGAAPARERRSYRGGYRHGAALALAA